MLQLHQSILFQPMIDDVYEIMNYDEGYLHHIQSVHIAIILISCNAFCKHSFCCSSHDDLCRFIPNPYITTVDGVSPHSKLECFSLLNQSRVLPKKLDGPAGAQVPKAPEFQRS